MLIVFAASYALRFTQIPYVSVHITNFAITGGFLCLSIFPDLLKRKLTKFSLLTALAFWLLVNIVVETAIKLDTLRLLGVDFINFNTPDLLDALYGIIAVAVFGYVTINHCTAKTKKQV